jgi:hypothetical protein
LRRRIRAAPANETETTISQLPLTSDVARRIARTVIDDDDVEIFVGLLRERP